MPTSNNLNAHLDFSGAPEAKKRQHICSYCDQVCSTSSHLARHRRIHSGVKEFVCDFPGCEKRSTRLDNLRSHQKVHANQPRSPTAGGYAKTKSPSSSSAYPSPMSSPSSPTSVSFSPSPEIPYTPSPRPNFHYGSSLNANIINSPAASAYPQPNNTSSLALTQYPNSLAEGPPYLHSGPDHRPHSRFPKSTTVTSYVSEEFSSSSSSSSYGYGGTTRHYSIPPSLPGSGSAGIYNYNQIATSDPYNINSPQAYHHGPAPPSSLYPYPSPPSGYSYSSSAGDEWYQ